MKDEPGQAIASNFDMPSCIEKALRLNNFTFNDEHFNQIKGTAVGTRVAPNFEFANVYMTIWVRFIDDIFFRWK